MVQRADLEAGKKPDKVVGAQAHKRTVAALQKQIAAQEKKVSEVSWGTGCVSVGECLSLQTQVVHDELQGQYTAAQSKMMEVRGTSF